MGPANRWPISVYAVELWVVAQDARWSNAMEPTNSRSRRKSASEIEIIQKIGREFLLVCSEPANCVRSSRLPTFYTSSTERSQCPQCTASLSISVAEFYITLKNLLKSLEQHFSSEALIHLSRVTGFVRIRTGLLNFHETSYGSVRAFKKFLGLGHATDFRNPVK